VLVLREAQDGSAGFTVQFEIVAPFELKLEGAMSIGIPTVPLVPVAPEKLIVGAEAPTLKVTVAVFEREELLAVTVKVDGARVAVGVPEITQVVLLIDAHDGRAGEIVQFEIVSPPPLNAEGVTVIGIATLPFVPVLEE
jgi:hypothetical protein